MLANNLANAACEGTVHVIIMPPITPPVKHAMAAFAVIFKLLVKYMHAQVLILTNLQGKM